jgi:hypothetical protein
MENQTIPTFETYVEDNFIRVRLDLYQSIDTKIYFTYEQVEARYANLKFQARAKKLNLNQEEKSNENIST